MRFLSGRARLCTLLPCLLTLAGVLLPGRAEATTAYGLTTTNRIITFDTNAQLAVLSNVPITGLGGGEDALAIDVRPATGQLYVLGSSSRLYVVNPITGVATAVGAAFTPVLSGSSFGFDFNPTVDRIRVVSDTRQNLRLNPDTGAVASPDTALNPGAPHIVGAAYANNTAGAPTTTLYVLDSVTDRIYIQNPPNDGTLTPLPSPLGVNASDGAGFDISAHDNRALPRSPLAARRCCSGST